MKDVIVGFRFFLLFLFLGSILFGTLFGLGDLEKIDSVGDIFILATLSVGMGLFIRYVLKSWQNLR